MSTTSTRIGIPEAMQVEHPELHEALLEATRAQGEVGAAARDVERVLHPHFLREERIALPPLGLLEDLARGVVTAEMAAVHPLPDALRAELPQMLEEHAVIRAALARLTATAHEQEQPPLCPACGEDHAARNNGGEGSAIQRRSSSETTCGCDWRRRSSFG